MFKRSLIEVGRLPRFRLDIFRVAGIYWVIHLGWVWVEVCTSLRRRSQ